MRPNLLLTYISLLLSGALFPLSLAPFSYWFVAIISIAILFSTLTNQTAKESFKCASIFGFGMFGTGVSWVFVSMYSFGDVSFLLALIGTLLFCLLNTFFFALPFMLCALIPARKVARLLALPAVWVIGEWTRSWILTGFPWLYAGYSHTDTWLSGWAPIGGVFLLSYFTAFAAMVLTQCLLSKKLHISIIGCIMVLGLFFSGLALQKINWTEPKEQSISVALIQPNVDQRDKWSLSMRSQIMHNLLNQTRPYWGTSIIIWPEGAIPALYTQVSDFLDAIHQQALKHKTALIVGLPSNTNLEGPYYNSMLALGEGSGIYNKTRLVPFGEYVPFESAIRGLNNFFDLPMSSFSLGSKNQQPLTVAGHSISTAICYEITYPDLVAQNTRKNHIILTVSNDAWFGDSIAPHQHMQMARMRAIENAKPIMRATNNGITALVDHHGKVYQQSNQHTEDVLIGEVMPFSGETPFSKFGSRPIVIFSLMVLLVLSLIRLCKNF